MAPASATLAKRRSTGTPTPQRTTKKVRAEDAAFEEDEEQRAAIRKINPENLDEEDEMIYDMKNLGFKDDIIAEAIRERGGTDYADKTISTRYTRIKRAVRGVEETKADLEFQDFTENHDGILLDFYEAARHEIHNDLELLYSSLLEKVYEKMKDALGAPIYSRNHLETRYHDLINGTARVPPERDENPEQRQVEAEARVAERKLLKEQATQQAIFEREEKERKAHEEEVAHSEAKTKREELKVLTKSEKELAKMKKEAEHDERERRRREQETAKAMKKQEILQQVERKKREQEEKRVASAKARRLQIEEREARRAQEKLEAANKLREAKAAELHAIRVKNICREVLFETMQKPVEADELENVDEKIKTAAETTRYSEQAKMTAKNAFCPRTFMKVEDLRELARSRELSSDGTKEELVERLADADKKFSVPALQEILANRGLKKGGMKMELLRRLAAADAGELVAGAKPIRNPAARKRSSTKKCEAKQAEVIGEDDPDAAV